MPQIVMRNGVSGETAIEGLSDIGEESLEVSLRRGDGHA
jgi:hypothetical protein